MQVKQPVAEIVTLAHRPDLAPTAADWKWHERSKHDGYSFEQTLEYVAASSAGIPQTFVLLVDGEPAGTSSLVAADMKERPDLTPWMASVFVVPEARRHEAMSFHFERVRQLGWDDVQVVDDDLGTSGGAPSATTGRHACGLATVVGDDV